eukprot:m.350762 g.350762  ORF g.350762 m.350762 type:complete len:114 (+) comp55906_c0_seq15:584-925(+)
MRRPGICGEWCCPGTRPRRSTSSFTTGSKFSPSHQTGTALSKPGHLWTLRFTSQRTILDFISCLPTISMVKTERLFLELLGVDIQRFIQYSTQKAVEERDMCECWRIEPRVSL